MAPTIRVFMTIVAICICFLVSKNTIVAQQPVPASSVADSKRPHPLRFIDTSFENASPVWYEIGDDGVVSIHLVYDHERDAPNRAAGHLHIRVESQPNEPLILEFRHLDNIYNGRPGSVAKEMGSLSISEDGKHWRTMKTQIFPNHVRLEITPTASAFYIARVEPFRLSDLANLLDRVRRVPHAEVFSIGKTVDQREIPMVRIGNPNAPKHVFVRARAHPWEAGGNWVVTGLLERLMQDDETSQRYRETYCCWILPMGNLDGVARGRTRFNMFGKDLNRNWDQPADPQYSPENAALERWLEARIQNGKRIDFALEVHNDGNGKLHHNAPVDQPDRYARRIRYFESLLRKHTWFREGSTQVMHGTGTLANGWQTRYGIDGAVHEFNCQWAEGLGVAPLGSHWQQYGAGLAEVFHEYFENRPE